MSPLELSIALMKYGTSINNIDNMVALVRQDRHYVVQIYARLSFF